MVFGRIIKVALIGLAIFGTAVAGLVAPPEMVAEINNHPAATWKAENSKWSQMSISEAKTLMGTQINYANVFATDFRNARVDNNIECSLCEYALEWVEKEIAGNYTESKIESALNKVCSLLPKSYDSMCENLVNNYTPEIINYIIQKESPDVICSQLGVCQASLEALPDNFDGRKTFGKCIHPVRNQEQCGSCWAFSASEVLSDRFCIASHGKIDVVLSPQTLVSCDSENMGCQGGYLDKAWEYLVSNGIALDQCEPYTSGGGDSGTCPTKCADGSQIKYYKAANYKHITGVSNIQTDLMTNGPVQVAFEVYQDFMSYKSGIYKHISGSLLGGHAVEMVGWGIDSGTAYWIIKNSWGPTWGESGYFRIVRGINECGIESNVYSGQPAISSNNAFKINARISTTDILKFLKGIVSVVSPGEAHWVSCAGDTYTIYTDIRKLAHDVHSVNLHNIKSSINEVKASLSDAGNLLKVINSAIKDCHLSKAAGIIGKVAAKISTTLGEIEEAVQVTINAEHIINDMITIVHSLESNNYQLMGEAIGDLVLRLA